MSKLSKLEKTVNEQRQYILQAKANEEFGEAARVQRLLNRNKKKLQKLKALTLEDRHLEQRRQVEEIHKRDRTRWKLEWDEKFTFYEKKSKELLDKMTTRHAVELRNLRRQEVGKLTAKKPMFSKHVLEERSRLQVLSKLENWEDAAKVNNRRKRLEKAELDEMKRKIAEDVLQMEDRKRKKQQNERISLDSRIESGRRELVLRKKSSLSFIVKRYQNIKADLMNSQRLENKRINIYCRRKYKSTPKRPSSARGSARTKRSAMSPSRYSRCRTAYSNFRLSPSPKKGFSTSARRFDGVYDKFVEGKAGKAGSSSWKKKTPRRTSTEKFKKWEIDSLALM